MVELVIKLDEKLVKWIEEYYDIIKCLNGKKIGIIVDAIKNGKPLPKGHGRIADMDEAIKCIKEVKGEDAAWAIGLIEWACDKRTIIEADRGEE